MQAQFDVQSLQVFLFSMRKIIVYLFWLQMLGRPLLGAMINALVVQRENTSLSLKSYYFMQKVEIGFVSRPPLLHTIITGLALDNVFYTKLPVNPLDIILKASSNVHVMLQFSFLFYILSSSLVGDQLSPCLNA